MNRKILAIAIGALAILPLGIDVAQSQVNNVNNIQEEKMGHHASRGNHGKRGDRGKRGERLNRLLQQLDLTPEQSEQIESIQAESRTAAQELKDQLETQDRGMRSLLTSDATVEQIRAEYQQAQAINQQLSDNRFEAMLQIREVLTSEQRAEAAELIESHRRRKRDERG
ncbi:MAG: Spy/CpxP family protein refolding chaperone [Cyanobacteria bacterium J06607_15]